MDSAILPTRLVSGRIGVARVPVDVRAIPERAHARREVIDLDDAQVLVDHIGRCLAAATRAPSVQGKYEEAQLCEAVREREALPRTVAVGSGVDRHEHRIPLRWIEACFQAPERSNNCECRGT